MCVPVYAYIYIYICRPPEKETNRHKTRVDLTRLD